MDGNVFWKQNRKTVTAQNDLDWILGSVSYLPMAHWRELFHFSGAPDEDIVDCTGQRFPARVEKNKTRPILVLKRIPQDIGAVVCPCSSKKPYSDNPCHFIKKGCRLLHKHFEIDCNSYILERFRFNIPVSLAGKLHFRGEVPLECIS